MPTLFNLMKKSFGVEIFTPDNQLTPVLRYGMYDRLALPGFSRITPIIERPLAPIKTSIRVALFTIQEVLSSDGIPFTVHLTILYQFDPRQLPRDVVAQFVTMPEKVLKDIVRDYTSQGLRRLAARHKAGDLCQEYSVSGIERDLHRYLNAQLRILGIMLPASGSVLIRETIPPVRYTRTMLDANLHEATINVLASIEELGLIRQALQAEFISNLENLTGNVIVTPTVEAAMMGRLFTGSEDGEVVRPHENRG